MIETVRPHPPANRPVAIMGFYGKGNFGDDLMAWICARHLAEKGIPSRLFSLGEEGRDSLFAPDFVRAGFPSTRNAETFLGSARLLVWGGGGMLASWQPGRFERAYPGVAERLHGVVHLARERGIPRVAISVGSHGGAQGPLFPRYKHEFLEGAHYASVRNRQDLDLASGLGVPADCFPDLVWQASRFFPSRRSRSGRLVIGIDLFPWEAIRQRGIRLLALLQAVALRRSDVRFVAINCNHRLMGAGSPMRRWLHGRNVEHYQFHDFETDMTFLASLDLLVSARLHVPLVCLQFGVPVISVLTSGKTRLLLDSIGLGEQAYGNERMGELYRLLSQAGRLDRFLGEYSLPDPRPLSEGARAHLEKLASIAARL